MTRSMGDAIHVNVPALHAAGTDMVAGYVTGTADIQWTDADWALFFGRPRVTIDQGYQSPAVTWAMVRDVEPSAWTPAAAVNRSNWTAARPTIYCDQFDLERAAGVLDSGWKGDLWLAIPGWQVGKSLPATPGCTVVAVQNQLDVNNAYDLSIVLDDTWPGGDPMSIPVVTSQQGFGVCDKCGCMIFRNLAGRPCPAGGTHDAPADYYDYSQQFIHVINGVAQ